MPGNVKILERMAGRVVEKPKEETAGGTMHRGRENGTDLAWFRARIPKADRWRAENCVSEFPLWPNR